MTPVSSETIEKLRAIIGKSESRQLGIVIAVVDGVDWGYSHSLKGWRSFGDGPIQFISDEQLKG